MSSTSVRTAEPPVVNIPYEVLHSEAGHQAYNNALDSADGVVVVPRQGRMEHIIDHKYAYDVLTDGKNFLFDKGVVTLLHLEFMLWFKGGSFVQELDDLTHTTVQARLGSVLRKLGPLLQDGFAEQFTLGGRVEKQRIFEVPDTFDRVQRIIAMAMVVLICGFEHLSPRMVGHFVATTNAIARICGFYEKIDRWPAWARRLYPSWSTTVALSVIIPRLLFGILPELWRLRVSHVENARKTKPGEFTPLFDHLLAHHWSEKQSVLVGMGNFLWCSIAVLGIIFASIHQTVVVTVWVIVELARRQSEYLQQIREEWDRVIPIDADSTPQFSAQNITRLSLLDSFIREVMRTKGDAFGPVRVSTRPVRVGGYVLPANAICLPYVRRAHIHPDNYESSGETFDGFRFVKNGRPAVQGNEGFLSFGLGRWACPGRHLAVAEIKILVYLLFTRFDVVLDEGSFEVLDVLNTTSVAPKATLFLENRGPQSLEP